MTLAPAGLNAIGQAHSSAISDGLGRLSAQFANGRLLSDRNHYRVDFITKLQADAQAGVVRSADLASYIAISAPLHCCEAWAFLGRAIACHLRGDSDAARHLAYYAELRGAMSLLATQGIGIFNTRHFAITAQGASLEILSQPPRRGTHVVAWDALEAWADLSSATDLVAGIVRPVGISIQQWVDSIPGGASWQPIATDWLRRLGLDLHRLSQDRAARNEASYRPTHLRRRHTLPCRTAAEAAAELWRLLEPASSLSFPQLDRFLLRLTIEIAFKATSGSSHRQAPVRFSNFVGTIVDANLAENERSRWRQFLLRAIEPRDPKIIDLVRLNPNNLLTFDAERAIAQADHHLAVIGRALILARLASGATRKLLVDSATTFDDLAFWWQRYGTDHGLWNDPPVSARLVDSWADTDLALSDLDDWLANPEHTSYYDFLLGVPGSITSLTGTEIVALWSMAS